MNKEIINVSKPYLGKEEKKSLLNVLNSAWLSPGPKTEELEDMISKKFQIKNVIAVNSCTNGILLSLLALGAKKKDEIITPAMTYVSTIQTLKSMGMKIKYCDINSDTLNIDSNHLKKLITKKTKFILPVNNNGIPINLEEIIQICDKKNIKIVIDAATSIGAKIKNHFCYNKHDIITVFSLQANKIITSGEGGVVCVKNNYIAKRIRLLSNSGLEKNSWQRSRSKKSYFINSLILGFKMNYNDIQASIAIEQFKKIHKILEYRKKIYKYYIFFFKKFNLERFFYLPKVEKNIHPSYYNFPIILNSIERQKRNRLIDFLNKKKIQTTIHYTPAHKHKFYRLYKEKINLKNTDFIFNRILSLPMHNHLKKSEISYICKCLKMFFRENDKI